MIMITVSVTKIRATDVGKLGGMADDLKVSVKQMAYFPVSITIFPLVSL
jgi:hypothetical protein